MSSIVHSKNNGGDAAAAWRRSRELSGAALSSPQQSSSPQQNNSGDAAAVYIVSDTDREPQDDDRILGRAPVGRRHLAAHDQRCQGDGQREAEAYDARDHARIIPVRDQAAAA